MATNYKTSADQAKAMVDQWYSWIGHPAAPADEAHFIKAVQQDGSQPAWDQIQKAANDSGNGQKLLAGANAYKTQTGAQPFELQAGKGQLAGTNTKNGGAIIDSQKSWLKPVAQIAANFIPAVGPLVSAGIGAAWDYADNHNVGDALKSGALSYVGGKLVSGLGNTGVGQAIKDSSIGQAVSNAGDYAKNLPGVSSVADAAGAAKNALSSTGNKIADSAIGNAWDTYVKQPVQTAANGVVNGAKSLLPGPTPTGGGGSGPSLPMLALMAAQGVNAAQLGAKSTGYAEQAANTANDNWNANAPLRTQGRSGILNPTTPDLSSLTALRQQPGNPFARPVPVNPAAPAVPSLPPNR